MDAIKKKILLVRHGTTEYNETDRLQGRIDNPLNGKGRGEVERLAARLKNEPLDAIFSSPSEAGPGNGCHHQPRPRPAADRWYPNSARLIWAIGRG